MGARTRRGLIAAVLTAAAVLGPNVAAHAADYSITATGAKLNYTIVWVSTTRAEPVNLRVFDTACDGRGVYANFTVSYFGGTFDTPKRSNYNGCNTDQSWNSYINDGRGIVGVRARICRDDGTCTTRYHDNPKN
jgi:hypothetical protein